MGRISDVKCQININEWSQQISECQSSGLTVARWCVEHNLKIKTYYYRLRKVREFTLDYVPAPIAQIPAETSEKDASVAFKKLEVEVPVSIHQPSAVIHVADATLEI